jgi:hypothetical protein
MTAVRVPFALPNGRFLAASAAVVLILARSVIWVFFEQSHFDSDQAVVGLMAKHLAEGRAFPLFFYGQHYMLAVEAWMAAPLFRLAGASVTTLKLPLLAVNIAIGLLLLRLVSREVGLKPVEAFLVAVFFVIPPPLVSARLVEAQGGNVEPLLYVLILWLLRDKPIVFGLAAGVAFLHREFAVYALGAIVLLDVLTRRVVSRDRLREYLMAWGAFALVILAVNVLKPAADLAGPGTSGDAEVGAAGAVMSTMAQFVCWRPAEFAANLQWLWQENLGVMFNWKPHLLGPDGWSGTPAGHGWLAVLLGALLVIAAVQVVHRRQHIDSSWQLGVYLMAVGAQAAFVYAVFSCQVRGPALIRYTLLTLFFPTGLLILFLKSRPARWMRAAVLGILVLWAGVSLVDNARFLAAYVNRPPPSPVRDLADYLESEGVRYGRGAYAIAYQLDFLTQERLTIASLDKLRVAEYRRIADHYEPQTVYIRPNRRWPRTCESGVGYRFWCLEHLARARGTVP